MFITIGNRNDLAKEANKFIGLMRAKLPTNNMGHIVFGTLNAYKEFAWIWPHIRCKLMDYLKPFRTKLITLMK